MRMQPEAVRRASILLKAVSNEQRLLLLCQLLDGEKSAGELERVVGLRQSALSQHLARLRHNDLVRTRRVAQSILYSLNGIEARVLIDTMYDLYCSPQALSPKAVELTEAI